MDTALTIITDIIIVVTFPLHCRYLYVMLRKDAQLASLEYAFRAALTNIVVANLLFSIIFILIQEPASYGLFADFYRSQSWWLGKISIMQRVPITLLTGILHVLIAINRLTALMFPARHAKIWSARRVKRILIVIWALTIMECIPLVYPIEGAYYDFASPIRSVGVSLEVKGTLPNLVYQVIAMGVGGVLEISVIFIYVFIGLHISRMKNLSKLTVKTTVAAVLVSTGGCVILIVYLPDMLASRIAGHSLWSYEIFNGLFKFAFAYNNAVAPWVMLIYYPNIRHLLIAKKKVATPTARSAVWFS